MRPIEDYANEVRALGKPVIAIVSSIECDDCSAWWTVDAYFAKQQVEPGWVEARAQGHEFEHYLVEVPPGEIDVAARKRDGSLIIRDPTPNLDRDLDGADREVAVGLGQALAASLGVPFFADPVERDLHLDWWVQAQTAKLVALLRRARHAVLVTGQHGTCHDPGDLTKPSRYAAALVGLSRRGTIKGIIDESSCDCLDDLGLPETQLMKSGGIARQGEADRIRTLLDRADLVVAVGSPLDREPLRSQVMDLVQSRGVPLVFVRYVSATDDPRASLIIHAVPAAVLSLLAQTA